MKNGRIGVHLVLLTKKEVKSQYSIRNMENRSVFLDVLAEDQEGRFVNVEMHPKEDEDHIPEVYLIYITEKDFIGENRGIYEVERGVKGGVRILNNGVHEFYVNLTGRAEKEEQRELLDYMVQSDSNHKTNSFPHLVSKVKMLKEKKEGIDIMCDIIEKERAEGKTEGKAEGIAMSVIEILGGEAMVSEELKRIVYSQRDPEVLTAWLKIAARSDSPEEFEAKLQKNRRY